MPIEASGLPTFQKNRFSGSIPKAIVLRSNNAKDLPYFQIKDIGLDSK
jgi:hypothetical protein